MELTRAYEKARYGHGGHRHQSTVTARRGRGIRRPLSHNSAMKDTDLPAFVVAEREALLAEIQEVFPGGSRVGGVSWSEADVIDAYGTEAERAAARAKDRDTKWQDLLEDPTWDPDHGWHWSFLDAIGCRYYLPAAMVYVVRKEKDAGSALLAHLSYGGFRGSQWMLLNLPQRLCIKRFLQYMGIVSAWHNAAFEEDEWLVALNSYWGRIPDES